MDLLVKHLPYTSSSGSWKANDVVSDQFPAGLRVLVVDDDPTCLRILEKMLNNCLYEVTTSNRAEIALKFLRENRNGYDIVISDVHMPDMDGFKLLEHVGLEMDLPVIMMSADDSKHVVMKGVTHGACDYLIKPVRMEALKNIWQHVVRKKKHEWRENKGFEPSNSAENGERLRKPSTPDEVDLSSSPNEGNWKNSRKRKEEEEDAEDKDDTSSLKKPRVVWSVELHQQFVNAVNQLGIDKAVPKKILELMNVPGLTRENVASHLQKYRLYLRRLSGVPQHQNGLNNPFMGPPDPHYGPISSLGPIDLQALAGTDQLPPQSLATIQVAALGRANNTKPTFPLPLVDQRNIFCFEGQNGNSAKKVNLLHGIPTNMDSKQLASLHQSAQSFGNVSVNVQPQTSHGSSLLAPMVQIQAQSRPPPQQISSDVSASHASNLPSSMGQSVCGPSSKSSAMMDFSRTQSAEFITGKNARTSSAAAKALQGEAISSYDTFGDLSRIRAQHEWRSPGTENNPIFSEVRGVSSNVSPSMLVRPALSSAQNSGQVRLPPFNVSTFSVSEDHGSNQINSSVADTSLRIKAERLPDMGFHQDGIFFAENYGQDDLMSAILNQQEGIAASDRDFGIDECQLDNLPV